MRIEAASRASLSGDGMRVVIVGNGRTPTGVVPESRGRLWLWDRTADTMEPVVVDTAGGVPDAPVALVAIAQDGLSVAFTSRATDLVTPTPPAARALYVQDLETGTLERFALANVTAGSERIVDASSDLTTFVTSAGKVVRIMPDRSALTVVQSYAGYVGIDVSADGSRVLLVDDRETRVADVSSPTPGVALPYLPGASLSGDGTTVALSVGVYSAGGAVLSRSCVSGDATVQTAIDMDGTTVVWGGYCPTSGIVEAAVSVTQGAGRPRLLLSSAIRSIPSLSPMGRRPWSSRTASSSEHM